MWARPRGYPPLAEVSRSDGGGSYFCIYSSPRGRAIATSPHNFLCAWHVILSGVEGQAHKKLFRAFHSIPRANSRPSLAGLS